MNFKLKPRVFLIGFLPGFLFIIAFVIIYKKFDLVSIKELLKSSSLLTGIAIVIFSFILGQVFDSIRDNFIEDMLFKFIYKKNDIQWDFFFEASEEEIDKVDNNYYLFYVININLSISLFIIALMVLLGWPYEIPNGFFISKCLLLIIIAVSIIILMWDAIVLRKDIANHTNSKQRVTIKSFPHHNVFTRLKPSEINGIGVFSIVDIPKGTKIFPEDNSNIIWYKESELNFNELPEEAQKLYKDFCVILKKRKTKVYGCPDNFTNLTMSWYLNNSKNPNVLCDSEYDFYALKDIKVGEELTTDYEIYSDE